MEGPKIRLNLSSLIIIDISFLIGGWMRSFQRRSSSSIYSLPEAHAYRSLSVVQESIVSHVERAINLHSVGAAHFGDPPLLFFDSLGPLLLLQESLNQFLLVELVEVLATLEVF